VTGQPEIMCFCGEWFSADRAVDFMRHVIAERGPVLNYEERERRRLRDRRNTPEKRAARRAGDRERSARKWRAA